MTKQELVAKVAEKSGLSKKAADLAVSAVIHTVAEELAKGEKVTIPGFGVFEVRERAARKGRNPQTGAEIRIKAKKVPVFKPGKALKNSIS
ncbi:MAG: HU family DNA-binding protein [Firmicutes bacterium]|nr:HU family DNA-binding protein [Bacillota bacterium]